MRACVCVRARVRVSVCACVRACVRMSVCVCARARASVGSDEKAVELRAAVYLLIHKNIKI